MLPQIINQYPMFFYQNNINRSVSSKVGAEKVDFYAKYEQLQTKSSTITEKQNDRDDWVNFIYKIQDGYSMYARYDKTSSNEKPVMYVELKNKDGKVTPLKIDINKIDPKNATRAEMFALITHGYKDDGKQLFNKTIGFSYHEGLSDFNNLSSYKNLSNDVWQSVMQNKMNFVDIYKSVSKILFGANDIRSYGRVTDMLSLFARFPK